MTIVFNKATKEVVTVIEDDNGSTTSIPHEYGQIQGDLDFIVRAAAAEGINIFNLPFMQGAQSIKARVAYKRGRGNQIITRFIEENEQISIDTQSNLQLLNAFLPIKMLLETGAITSARDAVIGTDASAFIVVPPYSTSEERKQSYLSELNDLVAQLSEE